MARYQNVKIAVMNHWRMSKTWTAVLRNVVAGMPTPRGAAVKQIRARNRADHVDV
jgi:hypothetical protein